jgi:tRNA 2-selenouridine synthase SelU
MRKRDETQSRIRNYLILLCDERYTEEDIDWIVKQLEQKVERIKEIFVFEVGCDRISKSFGC